MTTKGQLTLPANIRQKMELHQGDVLKVSFNPETQSIQLSKPITIDELSSKLTSYIPSGTKPVTDVNDYYQKHRQASNE